MSILPDFLRSLILTMVFSFATPILIVGGGLAIAIFVRQLPFLNAIGQVGIDQILEFLAIFGSGNPLQGGLIIGTTCSLVGALFDTYASSQNPRGH
ncbi:hypothetical protein [Lyngbya sp. CCY1209]|jgi:hypothetical protein|uniref:hypothetical protein n=1 Tax=Lyngbya sp. CCY1209 TaxID=2886103 RepID=UPI002D20BD66|nr:hypothetical protein [Lyngbya sp. CCY1209]MEB3885915.1 hypothetical protein [Lyngbya sp. CCY1209]